VLDSMMRHFSDDSFVARTAQATSSSLCIANYACSFAAYVVLTLFNDLNLKVMILYAFQKTISLIFHFLFRQKHFHSCASLALRSSI